MLRSSITQSGLVLRSPVLSSARSARQAAVRAAQPEPNARTSSVPSSSISPAASVLAAAAIPLALFAGCSSSDAATEVLGSLAGIDASQATLLKNIFGPVLNLVTFVMIIRIVMTWYPEIDGQSLPWSIAYKPTEPLLSATRKVIPPLSGVDISPIVWVGLISFVSETMLGPQGILSLIERQGGM